MLSEVADSGTPPERARHFESAGDASVYDDRIEEAKVHYGTAIDAYLDVEAFAEAIRICRKLIRIDPEVVRTRFTLLFLLVGVGCAEEARAALDEYLAVVQATGTQEFAIPRLQLLAHVTRDVGIINRIEEILSTFEGSPAAQSASGAALARESRSEWELSERWQTLLPIALKDE